MRAWGYYAFHSLINQIKKTFSGIFMIVLVAILIFAAVGIGGSMIFSSLPGDDTQVEEQTEEIEEDTNEDEAVETAMSAKDLQEMKDSITVAGFFIVLVLQILGFMDGAKRGSDIFTMADVNFLFPAPMKPQSVLLFRMTFAMLGALAGGIYLILQLPVWMSDLGVSPLARAGAMFAVILFLLQQKVLSVCSYTFFSQREDLKKYVRKAGLFIIAGVVCLMGVAYVFCQNSIFKAAHLIAVSPVISAIPFFGWTKGLVFSLLWDQPGKIFLFLALEAAATAAFLAVAWHVKADFYEDAFAGAEVKQKVETAVASGHAVSLDDAAMEKRAENLKKAEKKHLPAIKGQGAQVFFYRELCWRFRFVKLGLITFTFDLYLIAGLFIPLFLLIIKDVICPFGAVVIVFAVIMFFRNMGNPIENDMSRPWFVMVPENPYKKLFMALLGGTMTTGLDLFIPLFMAAFLCEASVFEAVMALAVMLVFDFFLSALSLIFYIWFPDDSTGSARDILKFLLKVLLCGLVLLGFILGWMLLGLFVTELIMTVVLALLSSIFFILDGASLHEGRK